MKKILSFDDFIVESNNGYSSLKKVYLTTKRSSGQKWLSYKGFAGNKFFIQITENNIDKLNIDKSYPVLNYHSDITNRLLDENKIDINNVYNKPSKIDLSGSKVKFHKLLDGDENIPKTVFNARDINKLKFPIIAKPKSGHSGIGISVFKDKDSLTNLDASKFDTFSEFIDKAEEHRFFMFKQEPIFWMERTPTNNKAKTGIGNSDKEMEFSYKRKDVSKIPKEYVDVLYKFSKAYKELPYICFDIMKSKNGKIYVIESNAQPGVPFDTTTILYEKIYEDFYTEPLDKLSKNKLDEYSKELIERTILKDNKRFS